MSEKILQGDSTEVLKTLETGSVQCCITSPPYFGLRDYGTASWEGGEKECEHIKSLNLKDVCGKCEAKRTDRQIGLEETPEAYVQKLVELFREVRRVLKDDGTLWLNLGDSYSSGNRTSTTPQTVRGESGVEETNVRPPVVEWAKQKDLLGIPWMVAFALRKDGWYLRQDIIWAKPNPMPESVTDRCTKAHEYIFLLSKSPKYYFDNEAIKELTVTNDKTIRDRESTKLNNTPGRSKMGGLVENNYDKRNKRSVWTVTTKPYKEAHFATFPESLVEPMVLAGSEEGDVILDPFSGAGTTGVVAKKLSRNYLGIELNPKYVEISEQRISGTPSPLF